MSHSDVDAVAQRLESRLTASQWAPLPPTAPEVSTAAEVADFALMLSGKRRQARRGGRLGRLIAHFALAACLALASVAAACDKPDASGDDAAEVIRSMPSTSGTEAVLTAQPRAGPAWFNDLVLADPGSDQQPWAVMYPKQGGETPVLVDRVGAGLDTVGATYRVPGQPVTVGTRDGKAQFLDPVAPAESTSDPDAAAAQRSSSLTQQWQQDERYLATTRAIQGAPTVMDAAYNADAAAAAGGTHTYNNGVVLRVDENKPVLTVVDKALLESGLPTRYEDLVYVAIPDKRQSLYEPGKVVNLNNVVMEKKQTDVNGQPATVYVANAALDGAEVPTVGDVNLPNLLSPRLSRVDQDLSAQAQEAGAAPGATPQASPAAAGTGVPVQQPVVVQNVRRSSYVDDFLIFMWLTNGGFYRGPSVIMNNPPGSTSRPGGDMYYSPSTTGGGTSPSSVAAAQAASRSTALQAARSSVSGQSAGTGGGVAATNKAAADATARVSAATSKGASVAGDVSSASAGKSISSAPPASSSTASRSAGSTSAGSRGSLGSSSSSSGSKGIGGSSGGFGGGGSSSSSSS